MPRAPAATERKAAPRKRAPAKKPVAIPRAPAAPRASSAYTYDKPGPWGKVGSWLGGALGNAYGGPGAGKVGSKIGSYAHYIGKIFGSGDYVTASAGVKSNNLINSDAQIPQFTGKNSVRIRHREYLGDIITSATAGAFSIQQFPINPGLETSFPWLSQVCGATFQQYRLNGMVFEFRSMSADALNSTNTALGSVVMATDYDSKDAPFTNKQQMENTMFGVSCKPSSCMIHAIECARSQTAVSELYIRPFAVPSGADVRLYDMGNFYIATNGMQGTNVNVGELWVSYDVTLLKEIEQPPAFLNQFAIYQCDIATANAGAPLGTVAPTVVTDQIGLTFTANKIQFPVSTQVGAEFVINIFSQTAGAATALNPPTLTFGNGMANVNGRSQNIPQSNPTTTREWGTQYYCKYNGGGTPTALPFVNIANYTWAAVVLSNQSIIVSQVSGIFN